MPVRFVRYDEVMYDYVKDGETTRNAHGKARKQNSRGEYTESPALASTWYDILDSQVAASS